MHLLFIYFLYFVLLDMTPIHCILFNPRPHLGGGGGATPQVVFLAGPNSVSDREPIFAYSCISNFSPGSLKFEVYDLWFMGCDLVLEVMSWSHFHFESYLNT